MAVLADTGMTIDPCYDFLGLIVIRYLFYRPCPFNSNITSLAKPTKANDDFAKGMTFLPNIDA